jgi:hypothetical protein
VASTPVNISTATTTTLVAAPTSPSFIRVTGYWLLAGGTTSVTLQDSTPAAMTGPMPLSATSGEVIAEDSYGVFDCAPGKALQLVNSAAIQVSGHVRYNVVGQ